MAFVALLAGAAAPPPPSGAAPLHERGAFETQAHSCKTKITNALTPDFGQLAVTRLQVPGTTTWDELVAHYGAAMRGIPALPVNRERAPGCLLQVWQGNGEGLAVGLLDQVFVGADGPFKVLFVVTPAL